MQAKTAAQIFHDWALTEGLMSESPTAVLSTAADMLNLQPITEPGKALLRQKRVLAVGFNEALHEVIAYTKLAAPSGKKALAALPSFIDDIKVTYRQGNHSVIGDLPPVPFGGPPYVVRQSGNIRFYTCGSSISVGNCVDSGTLSCLVRNSAGNVFGLSNNHVSGSCSFAEVGLPIVAPGLNDVAANGLAPFTLGLHSTALPMITGSPTVVSVSNNTDAALFEISDTSLVSSFQGSAYDTPATVSPLAPGQAVEKVGRTTGHTRGRVDSQIYGSFPVHYEAVRYGFRGSIYFDNVFCISGIGDTFSDNGDSGSLITTVDAAGTRHAVGIVFAGMNDAKAPGGKLTLALDISPILQALGVSLINGHNT
jgi:hypothetical protein